MMRSLKYQMMTNLRNLASILLILVLFIPYTFLIIPGRDINAGVYYSGMCFGVLLVLSIMFHFSTSATLVRMVLGYGATRKGWFWANVISKLVTQLLACAMVIFVATPLGTLVFNSAADVPAAVSGMLGWLPAVMAVSMLLACASEAAGYVMSRFNGKTLIFVFLIVVGIFVVIGAFLVFGFAAEVILSAISLPLIIAACAGLCVVFQIVSWRLIHKLPAA